MNKANVKLGVRYGVLGFLLYLAYTVISPTYLLELKDIDSMILNVAIASVYAGLTLVLKATYDAPINKE